LCAAVASGAPDSAAEDTTWLSISAPQTSANNASTFEVSQGQFLLGAPVPQRAARGILAHRLSPSLWRDCESDFVTGLRGTIDPSETRWRMGKADPVPSKYSADVQTQHITALSASRTAGISTALDEVPGRHVLSITQNQHPADKMMASSRLRPGRTRCGPTRPLQDQMRATSWRTAQALLSRRRVTMGVFSSQTSAIIEVPLVCAEGDSCAGPRRFFRTFLYRFHLENWHFENAVRSGSASPIRDSPLEFFLYRAVGSHIFILS
jgi:hypothetical protein